MSIPKTMKAARMHDVGSPMKIEEVPVPEVRSNDVLVKVHSCGIVPNLGNVLKNWTTWFPERPLPPLPAIFGLDPAGEIVAVGSQVHYWQPGDRVYVNPGRHCGGCRACRDGRHEHCEYYTFNGYFGFSEKSLKIFDDYPYGGLCQYMTAPQYSLVSLPDSVSYDQAARLGYLGTAYAGLRKAHISYEQERHPHVVATTRAAMELGRIICERDADKARRRDADLRAKQGGVIKTTIRQNMIPGLTSGLIDATAPGAGTLFPQPRVIVHEPGSPRSGWLDQFVQDRSCLLSIGVACEAESGRLHDLAQRINATLICIDDEGNGASACSGICVTEEGAVMAPWLESLGCRYVIARPDHYVYGAAPDLEALENLVNCYVRDLNG